MCVVGAGIYVAVSLQNLRVGNDASASTEEIANELVARKLLPSVSYAVIKNGKVSDAKSIGIADMETGAGVNDKTLYEAASLTKPLVAEIARRLYKDGVFSLDEKVADTLKLDRISDKSAASLITPRQLLSHTSGLPNWSGDSLNPNRTDRLQFKFRPGSEFQYSGEGYGILLAFLEAKSGQTADSLAFGLFKELGMNNSTLSGQNMTGVFARGHWAHSPSRFARKTSKPIAAYSLFTTAQDYARFLEYVMQNNSDGSNLADPFFITNARIGSFANGSRTEELGWSLGWGTLRRQDAIIYFQWGDNGAFRSFAAFDPARKIGIVYFSNGSFGTLYADELSASVLGDITTASSWFASPLAELGRTWVQF